MRNATLVLSAVLTAALLNQAGVATSALPSVRESPAAPAGTAQARRSARRRKGSRGLVGVAAAGVAATPGCQGCAERALKRAGKIRRISRGHASHCRVVELESDAQWRMFYEQMLAYKKEHGDCRVPIRWPPNPQLGSWVNRMRVWYQDYAVSCLHLRSAWRYQLAMRPLI